MSLRRKPVVAIDGPVGAGKTTVARAVARRLGFRHVDTGAMYRSVAWAALDRGVDIADEAAVTSLARALQIDLEDTPGGQRVRVDGRDVTDAIRDPAVSEAASVVSAYPGVREAMVARQRQLAAGGGVVMEGRDIGTVVCPDADVKVFLTASVEERARRRYRELRGRGVAVTLEEVRRVEEERDRRDRSRAHSPLQPAADAVVLDTTGLTVDEAVQSVLALCRRLLR